MRIMMIVGRRYGLSFPESQFSTKEVNEIAQRRGLSTQKSTSAFSSSRGEKGALIAFGFSRYGVMKSITVLAASGLLWPIYGRASESLECQVRVLTPVTDDLGNHWEKGKVLPVDIERDDKNVQTYCASGGSCIPRLLSGKIAVSLLNCKVGPVLQGGDRRLIPTPARIGGTTTNAMLSHQATVKRLSELGLSNASAGSLADDYVNRPRSKNGRLVAQALAGSSSALATLKRNLP